MSGPWTARPATRGEVNSSLLGIVRILNQLVDNLIAATADSGGGGAVSSVNTRTGDVTGLAEASDLASEVANRTGADVALAAADTALDGRLDVIEAVGPLASAASVAAEVSDRAAADAALMTAISLRALASDLLALAPLASPALTGNPTAPTQTAGNSTTRLATTAFVQTAAAAKVVDAIADAVTDVAPSQNAVFDALAGKSGTGHAHGADATKVDKATLDANSVLYAVTDDTPAALAMAASTILARLAAGNIVAATPAQLKALLAIASGDVSGLGTAATANKVAAGVAGVLDATDATTTNTRTPTNATVTPPKMALTVALTDGANIATDASLAEIFSVTIAGNRTIDNPTNPTAGQTLIYRIKQDAAGSRTITWGSEFRFGTDVPSPTLTTTAAKTDYIGFRRNTTDTKWDCLAVARGY